MVHGPDGDPRRPGSTVLKRVSAKSKIICDEQRHIPDILSYEDSILTNRDTVMTIA